MRGPTRSVAMAALATICLCGTPPLEAQVRETQPSADEWRADLDTMAVQMRAKHWDLFHTVSRATFDSAVAALKDGVAQMEWAEILVEIARTAALVEDGHTRFWLNRFEQTGFRQLPVRLYRFSDGWHVRSVDGRHAWAAGRRILNIDGMPIAEAFERVAAVISHDNPRTDLAIAPAYLAIPDVLHALGITRRPDRATLTLAEGSQGRRELTLEAIPGAALAGLDVDHNPPGVPFDVDPEGDGVRLVDALAERPPAWLEDPERNLVVRHLPESDALYVRLTRIGGTADETFANFMERTYEEALRLDVERYVLDVRRAWGGDNQLVLPAVLALVRRTELDRPGRVWVLIGRHTFSATTTLVTLLDRMTNARFVGEPTGGKPNYYADARRTVLPRAGLTMGASSLYWQDSDPWDGRSWHPPELAAGLTSADYAAGRDPVLEAALTATVDEPLRARLPPMLEAGDSAGALQLFRAYRADPRRRWVRDEQAPATLFREMGDEFVVSGKTDAAIAAWTAGLAVHPEPEAMRSRLAFVDGWRAVRGAERAVSDIERDRLTGRYGRAQIVADGARLVYVTPSGERLHMIPIGDRTYAFEELAWIRVRFPGSSGAPDRIELVFYDGETELRRRVQSSTPSAEASRSR